MKVEDIQAIEPSLTPSERRLLGRLFRRGAMTQADLVLDTELTQQSISRLVSKLTEDGLVQPGDKTAPGKRGYPSAVLELKPDYAFSFGLALMADAAAVALVDFAGHVRCERRQPFSSLSRDRVIDWTATTLAAIVAEFAPGQRLVGAGIGLPGSFIGDGVGFNTPHYLEDWAGIDVEAPFAAKLGLPVWADNDGNVAALGESMIGVGRWARNFAYLYIGAGVGGGLVLDGEVWRGRHGNAGEFAGGLPSTIYPFPNLELLRQIVGRTGNPFATVEELVEQWNPSWPGIEDWIARVRDSLSIIASNATAILDLDAIVLGGRMPRSLAERVIPAIELYDQRRRSVARPTAKIVPAETVGNAAAIGAALLPLKHKFFA